MALELLQAGPMTTIQDLGRIGAARWGYRRCGACDKYAMRLANILVGNPEDTAVLEFTLSGGKIRFTGEQVIALAGADMTPKLDGRETAMFRTCRVQANQVLELGIAKEGLRTYLAVRGGIEGKKVLDSASTDTLCGMGGFHGRALKTGDILETENAAKGNAFSREFEITEEMFWLKRPSHPWRCVGNLLLPVARVVLGPQDEMFSEQGKETLRRGVYQVSADSNRMACRLEGPVLEAVSGYDIISDGVTEGSIQVSSSGMPMVMLADHQTTGGYAKIGTVIRSDIPALAQRRPGEWIGFEYVTPEEAGEAWQKERRKLAWLREKMG